jgi:protein-disulfide isomerase
MKQKVDDQYLDGINAGVGGTPYSFLITPSGSKTPIPGAIEYSTLKSAIDIVLSSQSASAN